MSDKEIENFESTLIGLFMEKWGARENQLGKTGSAISNNAQNPFDAFVGDVFGNSDSKRFFIIEFKRSKDLFPQELLLASGKLHRYWLALHLLKDFRCAKLSWNGHFGGYGIDDILQFGTYYNCIKLNEKKKIAEIYANSPSQYAAADVKKWECNFPTLFTGLNHCNFETEDGFFKYGIGLPWEAFAEYIKCMNQHSRRIKIQDPKKKEEKWIFGSVDPVNKQFFSKSLRPRELIDMILGHLAKIAERKAAEEKEIPSKNPNPFS